MRNGKRDGSSDAYRPVWRTHPLRRDHDGLARLPTPPTCLYSHCGPYHQGRARLSYGTPLGTALKPAEDHFTCSIKATVHACAYSSRCTIACHFQRPWPASMHATTPESRLQRTVTTYSWSPCHYLPAPCPLQQADKREKCRPVSQLSF